MTVLSEPPLPDRRATGRAALLDVRGLSVGYGKVEAVHDISLHVSPGQIVTVFGPNGAGKTTLLNAIMGLLKARGEIFYEGKAIGDLTPEERVASGMSLVPERRELFSAMSIADNLLLGSFTHYLGGRRQVRTDLDKVYMRFPRLRERSRQTAATLSGGERQMLALGRALMSRPKLLMLDEPSLGLAPLVVQEIMGMIIALRETGASLLLVEQNARLALKVADYGYVLDTGRIVLEGPAAELAQNERVIEAYLGLRKRRR